MTDSDTEQAAEQALYGTASRVPARLRVVGVFAYIAFSTFLRLLQAHTHQRTVSGGSAFSDGECEVAHFLQQPGQQPAEVVGGQERARMPVAEGLAFHLQRLEVDLVLQEHAEVVDVDERVRMPTASRLARHLQRLAQQQFSGGEVALGLH
eukprot:scaffold17633_cov65-Phaeocystis_antarctica.AAC.3